jgi:hypothetical protein
MTLRKTEIATSFGAVRVLETEDGKYRVWLDRDGSTIRWALADWPDDGWGLPAHGAGQTVAAVEMQISRHRAQVGELPR